jgi:hypothetical protein
MRMRHHRTGERYHPSITEDDAAILSVVEHYLDAGLELQEWWERTDANDSYRDRFAETLTYNRPEFSFGFFDEVEVDGQCLPIMGSVQEMMYDRAKASPGELRGATEELRKQLREFVLHYFMRVSAFRPPQVRAESDNRTDQSFPGFLSWCPDDTIEREGFGFSQLYYKRRDTEEIGKFREGQKHRIVDLREIGPKYEWIVLKVAIHNFSFTAQPFGQSLPSISVPLKEFSYLIVTRDFIRDVTRRDSYVLGEYGLGYAFLKDPLSHPVLAYGPGQFDAAFEQIMFRVLSDGAIRVRMVFVANRPTQVVDLGDSAVDLGFRFADFVSFGMASRVLEPVKDALSRTTALVDLPDPVFTYIDLMDTATGGYSKRELCISGTSLDKIFLLRHFNEHYQAISGSTVTWRQIPDWLDEKALPRWIVSGESA